MALLLGAVFQSTPEYTLSIASGCLLVGPFLAMDLVLCPENAPAHAHPEADVDAPA